MVREKTFPTLGNCPSLVISSEAEGPAVPRTFPGNVSAAPAGLYFEMRSVLDESFRLVISKESSPQNK